MRNELDKAMARKNQKEGVWEDKDDLYVLDI